MPPKSPIATPPGIILATRTGDFRDDSVWPRRFATIEGVLWEVSHSKISQGLGLPHIYRCWITGSVKSSTAPRAREAIHRMKVTWP
eukprot:7726415-Prorocentrum_lima.AAC.1